jgi:hypothetical protein
MYTETAALISTDHMLTSYCSVSVVNLLCFGYANSAGMPIAVLRCSIFKHARIMAQPGIYPLTSSITDAVNFCILCTAQEYAMMAMKCVAAYNSDNKQLLQVLKQSLSPPHVTADSAARSQALLAAIRQRVLQNQAQSKAAASAAAAARDAAGSASPRDANDAAAAVNSVASTAIASNSNNGSNSSGSGSGSGADSSGSAAGVSADATAAGASTAAADTAR